MFKQGLIFTLFIVSGFAETEIEKKLTERFFLPSIDSVEILDWYHPTISDFYQLQQFMKERHRAHITRFEIEPASDRPFPTEELNKDFYGWLLYRSGRIGLIKNKQEMAGKRVIHFNQDQGKKDRCIICYAGYPSSWNGRDYEHGMQWMIKALEKVGFEGDLIYYLGGWPGVLQGRLRYVDVPFSFKPFLFEEVRAEGYKQILWLDACSIPVSSLEPLFQHIEEKGIAFYSYRSTLQWREFIAGYSYLMPFLEIAPDKKYEEISSQVVGLNMNDKKANELLDEWLKAAEKRVPFLQSDEPPFMYLVNSLKMQYGRMPEHFYIETPCNTGDFSYWKRNPRALIYHQYDFVNAEYPISEVLFEHP